VEQIPSPEPQVLEWIDSHAGEMVAATQSLIRIPSTKGHPATGAPFGLETRQALDCVLSIGESYGLTVKNLDGYAGHIEWRPAGVAAEAPIVGVLAHVDVVPAGDGWTHPPFDAVVDNGVLYGRGAIDDKGPLMAGLYATLALAACKVPAKRRLRVIVGADEESGFGCVAHYFAHEEMPVTGFSPDADFPLIHAEKGITNIELKAAAPAGDAAVTVTSLHGGRRPNMVPDTAEAMLQGDPRIIGETAQRLAGLPKIETETMADGARLKVVARGVSAHGMAPHLGDNAVVTLAAALRDAAPIGETQAILLGLIATLGSDITGGALGIAGRDDVAGALTSNLGIAVWDGAEVTLTFNIRYPVTWTIDDVLGGVRRRTAGTPLTVGTVRDQGPLHVPMDDPLVATLLDVYRSDTGDMSPPETTGGGTYARAMKKGVAFGAAFPGTPGRPHEVDERWDVADQLRATKIYAKALMRLLNESE